MSCNSGIAHFVLLSRKWQIKSIKIVATATVATEAHIDFQFSSTWFWSKNATELGHWVTYLTAFIVCMSVSVASVNNLSMLHNTKTVFIRMNAKYINHVLRKKYPFWEVNLKKTVFGRTKWKRNLALMVENAVMRFYKFKNNLSYKSYKYHPQYFASKFYFDLF